MKKTFSIIFAFIAIALTSCSSDDDNAVQPSSLAEITDFSLTFNNVNESDINYDLGTNITVSVPFGTSLEDIIPNIAISEGATITPASGEQVDFVDGEAKTFTVTAEDGSVKEYTVTVNVRGEVGSGSRLKTVTTVDDYSFFVLEETTSYTYDETSGFVNSYTTFDGFDTVEYTLIYDDKNQVTEKTHNGGRTEYTYEDGKITKAEEFEDDALKYVFTYSYNEQDLLAREERTNHQLEEPTVDDIRTFTYDDNGNVIKFVRGTSQSTIVEATYDDKNNPYKGIYPAAYAAIKASIDGVNTNNPITRSEADEELSYEYNTDDYPVSSSYSNAEAGVTYTSNFTYYAE